jgi:hypothetical protein
MADKPPAARVHIRLTSFLGFSLLLASIFGPLWQFNLAHPK